MKLAVRIAGMGASFAADLTRITDAARTPPRVQPTVSDPEGQTLVRPEAPSAVAVTMVPKQE